MATAQLRAELFREMNPLLDSDVMLRKMLAFVKSLFAAQQMEQEAAQKKGYKMQNVSPEIEKWSGCATFTQEEIDSDPRLKAILSR
jgi:exonuclease III